MSSNPYHYLRNPEPLVSIPVGTWIRYYFQAVPGSRFLSHHAIVISSTHAVAPDGKTAVIREPIQLECAMVYKRADQSSFTADEIVHRVLSRIGDTSYNILAYNCEGFCNWCYHDTNYSHQATGLTAAGGAVVGATGILATGAAAVVTTVPAAGVWGWVGYTTTVTTIAMGPLVVGTAAVVGGSVGLLLYINASYQKAAEEVQVTQATAATWTRSVAGGAPEATVVTSVTHLVETSQIVFEDAAASLDLSVPTTIAVKAIDRP